MSRLITAVRELGSTFRQPTDRNGWVFVVVASLLLGIAALVENRSLPEYTTPFFLVLSIGWVMAAALLAYPLPYLGLLVGVSLSAANLLIPAMPHGGGTQLIASMFLVGFLAFRLPGRWSIGAWLMGALVPAVSAVIATGDLWELMFYLMFLFPAWFVGVLLQREQRRSRELTHLTQELAAEREHRTETALLAERTRIARELHDAVAHSVSVMTLQIGVVRRRLAKRPDQPAAELDTLQQAERLGRQSVDELRRIVGLARPAGPDLAPVPSLRHLETLVEQVRSAGAVVELATRGGLDDLAPTVDVSAYRIVQEALTNALKHAPGAAVQIEVVRTPVAVAVTVRDDGPPGPSSVTAGNGLTGMTERVAMLGGRLSYRSGTPRGFVINAELPLGQPVAPARQPEPVA